MDQERDLRPQAKAKDKLAISFECLWFLLVYHRKSDPHILEIIVIKDEYPFEAVQEQLLSRYCEYYHDSPRPLYSVLFALLSRAASSLKNWLIIFCEELVFGLGMLVYLLALLIYWIIFG